MLITIFLVVCFSLGAFFIFVDNKEREVIGYGFTLLAMIGGVRYKYFSG
ncbi:MAG: hypothetical protein KKA05_10910 [Alphaproteobacteria bacterium]|nr:hypothetical protein [Alphaproteobacteria bacterium]